MNVCWRGRKFKTDNYKDYEKELFYLLPKMETPKGKLQIHYIFGFSTKNSDIDNPVKPFTDILQKTYNFNDRDIYILTIEKQIVKKGKEFIKFTINEIH